MMRRGDWEVILLALDDAAEASESAEYKTRLCALIDKCAAMRDASEE